MAFDAHANLAYGLVLTPPSPPASGLTLVLSTGAGALFPAAPFNATIWPAGVMPLVSNAEIVRVTAVTGDTLTIVRGQEGTGTRVIIAGDQVAATVTAKMITDLEAAINTINSTLASVPKLVAVPATMASAGVHPSFAVDSFYRYETIATNSWKQIPHSDF